MDACLMNFEVEICLSVVGDIAMVVDGVKRGIVAWEEWAVTTKIDGRNQRRTALRGDNIVRSTESSAAS